MRIVHGPARALVLLVLLAVMLSGCEDQSVDERRVVVGPAPRPAKTREPSADAAPRSTGGVAIAGRVATDEGVPIGARKIDVVDARGRRSEVLTDPSGAFYLADVVKPYDLAVAGESPTVFLGLEREDPWLELFEREGASTRPPAQPLRVAVRPPPCASETCAVSVVSASSSGSGAATTSYAGDGQPIVFELEHEWSHPLIPASETISVHVLTSDAEHTTFAYGSRSGIQASGGEPTDLGTIEPDVVASTTPLAIRTNPRGVSASWAPSLATWLELPGGASIALTYATTDEEILRLPVITGASLRATAWMQHPPVQERPYFQQASQAWSGPRRLAGGALTLDLLAGPAPVRPSIEGTLSRRGLGIAWRNGSSATPPLTEMTLTDVTRGVLRYRVWTMGEDVPFAKLELLGLGRAEPGDHVLGLTSTPRSTLDSLVDAEAEVRRHRFDAAFPGSASYQRFRFRVTP